MFHYLSNVQILILTIKLIVILNTYIYQENTNEVLDNNISNDIINPENTDNDIDNDIDKSDEFSYEFVKNE